MDHWSGSDLDPGPDQPGQTPGRPNKTGPGRSPNPDCTDFPLIRNAPIWNTLCYGMQPSPTERIPYHMEDCIDLLDAVEHLPSAHVASSPTIRRNHSFCYVIRLPPSLVETSLLLTN
uniref:Uncharacterized protein n=1 Tax=Hyaloperonospora arabidopsidis (strain Emoy2) TaxID=559515 RepID=M4B813_HYAAE